MTFIKYSIKRLFQFEAGLIIKKYKPKIIAITGSVGKTTTRDFLYGVLSKKFFVRKSGKSLATGLGVTLTVIGRPRAEVAFVFDHPFSFSYFLKIAGDFLLTFFFGLKLLIWKENYPDWLILEIDADKPGDVDSISDLLKIDILIITAIGAVPSHIESFGSDMEKFLAEKKKLLNLVSRQGTIVYNSDDEITNRLVRDNPSPKISCGLAGDSQIRGSDFEILTSNTNNSPQPTGMKFDIFHSTADSEKTTVTIMDSIGLHNEYAVLLSIAVSDLLGIPPVEATKMVEKIQPLPGRMKIISGVKDSIIIDDSYNSSPIAMRQAVENFAKIETSGRKIIVIGDMLELGKYSTEEHRKIGHLVSNVAQYVICVGLRARHVAETILSLSYDENNISCFDDAVSAGKFLQNIIESGDLILVKGSQAMRLERVVEEIMRHPEDKSTLLVRQEPEWLSRD